jgi:hypothetical protein
MSAEFLFQKKWRRVDVFNEVIVRVFLLLLVAASCSCCDDQLVEA